MSNKSLELWTVASELLQQARTVIVQTNEFWLEIGARFDEPVFRDDIPPELRADFLLAQVSQLQFFSHATKNLEVLKEILYQGKFANEAASILDDTLNSAAPAVALKALTMPREEHQALIQDFKSLPGDREAILVNASAAIIAAITPWIFVRDAFAVYLNKPTLGANAYTIIVTLVKEGGLHELAKAIPFVGTLVALAEAMKKQEERGYEEFKTFIAQSVAHLNLTKAIDQALSDLANADQALKEYRASIHTVNIPFMARIARVVAFLED